MLGIGEGISIIGLSLQLWKKYKSAQTWETQDKQVDSQWLDLAKEKGVLDLNLDYRWSRPEKVETRLFQESHDVIYALDEENKIKYRIFHRDLVLVARVGYRRGQ
jgi:protein-tyrosine-phosphatase